LEREKEEEKKPLCIPWGSTKRWPANAFRGPPSPIKFRRKADPGEQGEKKRHSKKEASRKNLRKGTKHNRAAGPKGKKRYIGKRTQFQESHKKVIR